MTVLSWYFLVRNVKSKRLIILDKVNIHTGTKKEVSVANTSVGVYVVVHSHVLTVTSKNAGTLQ
jgi:hypothetical protein